MASTILAASPGWKFTGPTDTQMREPLMVRPITGTSGSTSRTMPSGGERVAVALEVAGAADEDQGGDEGADADRGPQRLQAGEAATVRLGLVEADDEHVADAVEQGGQRAAGCRRRWGRAGGRRCGR